MHRVSSHFLLLTLLLAIQLLLAPACISRDIQLCCSPISFERKLMVNQAPIQTNDIRFGYNRQVIDGSSQYPEQVEPTLAVLSTGQILVGWKEADTYDGPGRRVGFSYSTDKGDNFSPNILMTPLGDGEHQSDPWLVVDNQDNAYFVWIEYDGPNEGIGVAKTTDRGVTWQAPVQASDTIGYLDDKETAVIDDAGNIYLTWDHFTTYSTANLVFTKSTDGGATFQPTTILGPWENVGGIPYITCTPNGTLYISTIYDSDPSGPIDTIFITCSTDFGTSWSPKYKVNPLGSGEIAIITVVKTDSNGNVYLAYAAGTATNKDIYVTKSTPGGTNWTTPVQVNDETTGMQRMVEMTIDQNDNIHVAWLDARNDQWDIYYSYSDDGGITFHPNVRITTEGFHLSYTRPGDYFTMRTGPDGQLFIVWTDGRRTDQDIYFARQDLENPVLSHIPPAIGYQYYPLVLGATATDDDYISQVEIHYRLGGTGSWEIQQMIQVGENQYQGIIPLVEMVGSTIDYYLIALDSAGRNTTLPTTPSGMYSLPISPVSPTIIITIIGSAILLIVVIIAAIWYLRRPPTKRQQPVEGE